MDGEMEQLHSEVDEAYYVAKWKLYRSSYVDANIDYLELLKWEEIITKLNQDFDYVATTSFLGKKFELN